MQRRNVLLPEPDGPIMHMTSFGCTSRSMPRNTSRRPKLLFTASAFTMGELTSMRSRQHRGRHHGAGWWRVKRDEHAPESLERRERQLSLRTAREVPLHIVLADREDGGQSEVPEADVDQQLDDAEVER